MNKTILKIKALTGIFSLLFLISSNQFLFAQLTPVVNPLFTQPVADPLGIPKFVNPLPIVPRLEFPNGGFTDMYMGAGSHDFGLLPGTLLNATVWGYNNNPAAFGYLGPTIVAKENQQLNVQWHNNLGNSYPLPLDETLHWAFAGHMGMNSMYNISTDGIPAVPHLHGGNTESASDGLPEAWGSPEMMVNAKSIMGVMMLAAEHGSTLVLRADGVDAEAALEALAALVAAGFGET